jgi:Ni,Fe-hydrogenase I cytochrome b subunit
VVGGSVVAWLWFTARQQSRWLCALPVNARALLLTILTPILLMLAAGYFTGISLPKKHPVPAPDFNVQVLTVGVSIGWVLIVVLCMALYEWRRLGRFPKWVRALPALLLVGVPWFVPGTFFFVPSAMDQFVRLQRDILQAISHAIPGGVFGAVAASVAALTALYWAVEKVFSEPEFAGKPRPPQDFEFLRR